MKPLVRWTIGDVRPAGYECLAWSIEKFTQLYNVDVKICHNCDVEKLSNFPSEWLFDQRQEWIVKPEGVAWKLYPPRLSTNRHELLIDNDIIIEEKIKEIDDFFDSDCTLLLEDVTRNYGKFENHVPPNYQINSGIYGMPPNFNLAKYIDFYVGTEWEINAKGEYAESRTFDEQGLVAISLLNYKNFVIIPNTSVIICEREYKKGSGMHFIGLNRKKHHRPFQIFKTHRNKFYL